MEAKLVTALRGDCELEEGVVAEPGLDRAHSDTVPLHIHKRRRLLVRGAERAVLEESDAVLPPGNCFERLDSRERPREGVFGGGGPEEGDAVTRAREWLKEEDGCIERAACRARANPIGVACVEAEVITFVERLEPTVNDVVDALVSARLSDLEVSLPVVVCGAGIGGNKVLHVQTYSC